MKDEARANSIQGIYAHSKPNAEVSLWQTLADHSEAVGTLASKFAKGFGSHVLGGIVGRIHDLGKASAAFQGYLRRCNGLDDAGLEGGGTSHSGAGACWLYKNLGNIGKALSYCVAGHHAGLPDWTGGETPDGALSIRIENEMPNLDNLQVRDWLVEYGKQWNSGKIPPPIKFSRDDSSMSFWIRMMYSCLVDADFLDTEAFMDAARASLRHADKDLAPLAERFSARLDEKQKAAPDTHVNRIRAEIRGACEAAAKLPPGLFSLTVPTGGGKTLSGTAFAFKHALQYGLKRIIYVIPYTSIIEQTADVLREFLGAENVLEHHSNLDPEKETMQSRLASENWDAPVVVTTAVQFFESLYACKSSQCRKLHNIAESIVILDEVQLLPTRLLLPCAEAIRQLVSHYKTSVVLSTATQLNLPLVDKTSVREIIPKEFDLYSRLRRTQIEFPSDTSVRRTWDEIADELKTHERVLCVVNTRRDCRELFNKMPEGTIHLSAGMCGAHRSRVIADIKARLAVGEPVRVISTQLVEAGVDIDFPVVYRAFTGLSSIAQSAGRCNREGCFGDLGRVIVFMPPEESPVGELRKQEDAMRTMLERAGGINPDDADSFPDYFRALHGRLNNLGTAFRTWLGVPVPIEFMNGPVPSAPDPMQYQFREAAAAFQMIDGSAQVPVIVRYGDAARWIAALCAVGPKRDIMRRLQRYTVNIPRHRLGELREKGFVEELRLPPKPDLPSGIFVQTVPSVYSEAFGLDLFRDSLSAEECII